MPETCAPVAIDAPSLARRFADRDSWALVDVRDAVAYERHHLFGATSLPRRMLELRIGELVPDHNTPIVVCDDAEGRAELAARTLARHGYAAVAWLTGGLEAAAAAGLRVVSGTNVPSKLFGEEVVHGRDVPAVSADTLAEWLAKGRDVVVCDVRTPEEYRESCIPGAFSAPSFDIALAAADLAAAHATVVVNCAGRTRSIIGAQTLRELGLRNVVALENGLMGWRLAGRAVEEGAQRSVPAPRPRSVAFAAAASRRLADEAGVARLDTAALTSWLAQRGRNGYAFDVRAVREYMAGHIPGTIALPGGQAVQRTDDFVAIRSAPIVLIDEHGVQADLTATWLRRMGLSRVAVLDGGIEAWRRAGGALAEGRPRATPLGWDEAVREVRMCAPAECAQRLAGTESIVVLDVDGSRHYRNGHVADAVWVPRGDLEARIGQVAASHATPLLVTCATGVQSVLAAATLRAAGYADVTVLEGGTQAWHAAGLPLERATLPPQDDDLLPPYQRGLQAMRDYIDWEKLLVAGGAAAGAHDTGVKEGAS
jgi:rhodanese-related sulfurtransferase